MISLVETAADWTHFRDLVVEYAEFLGVDLNFQGFDDELATLDEMYVRPTGAAFLASVDDEAVGCVGVLPLEGDVCELKRMYLQPAARGHGLGRALVEHAAAMARDLGYARMRLDTLPRLETAVHIYASMGFRVIARYNDNPLEGVRFFELTL